MCHSRQPGTDIQQALAAINLLPEPSTQPSQDITLGLTSWGPVQPGDVSLPGMTV